MHDNRSDMDYESFLELLERCGLSGRRFSMLLNLNPNAVSNCKKQGYVPSLYAVIASLIEMGEKANLDYKAAIGQISIKKKMPRGRALETKRTDAQGM